MSFIKNFDVLATSPSRKDLLKIVEAGFVSIQPQNVLKNVRLEQNVLTLPDDSSYALDTFDRVFLIGFGKGSAGLGRMIEEKLDGKLTAGWVIDTESAPETRIIFSKGSHPLPGEGNLQFTNNLISKLGGKLARKDLVLVVICGGGSAMFTSPRSGGVDKMTSINETLLKSGASIFEINTVRKKLDLVKGGGLAKMLFPACVVSLVFSDVPGNDLSVIASGPTVKDSTTVEEAWKIIRKFGIEDLVTKEELVETPDEERIFENVHNILALSNLTAIQAMSLQANELGYQVAVHSDVLQGEASAVGKELAHLGEKLGSRQLILSAGETTVTVRGDGRGGRNQELVLGALVEMSARQEAFSNVTIASFASDGWDNTEFAGGIGDRITLKQASEQTLDLSAYLENNDAFSFFKTVGQGIETGRLPSNVSDLMIVLKA